MRDELFSVIKKCFSLCLHSHISQKNWWNKYIKSIIACNEKICWKIKIQPNIILVDGNKSFNYDAEVIPIVKGDSKSLSIASASIIAKVVRDRLMENHAIKYPDYGWQTNKGYPTKEHINAVLKYGACSLHRKTFLKKYLNVQIKQKYYL